MGKKGRPWRNLPIGQEQRFSPRPHRGRPEVGRVPPHARGEEGLQGGRQRRRKGVAEKEKVR